MRTSFRIAAAAGAAALASLSLSACQQATPQAGTVNLEDGLQIVTTTTQVTDFAKAVTAGLDAAGTKVEITPLLSAGESAHSFEPTAADLTALAKADVVIESGMQLESWLDDAITSSGFAGQRIDSSEGFDPESMHEGHDHAAEGEATASETAAADEHAHESEDAHAHEDEAGHNHAHEGEAAASEAPADAHDHAAEGDAHAHEGEAAASEAPADGHDHAAEEGHDHGDDGHHHHDGPNPHLWAAPKGAETMVTNITEGLATVDTKDAEAIRANGQGYLGKLEQLTTWIQENVDKVPEAERTLVTSHDAMDYFNQQFHITHIGSIIPSWDDAAEPSAQQIDELVKNIKDNNVKAIFTETQLPADTANTIAQETGAKVFSGKDALYTDALGDEGTPEGTYLGAQIHNTTKLMESWGQTASEAPAELRS